MKIKTKKKILVIGSISDFGGREVEVNTLVRFLELEHSVKLFSTIQMTEKSTAVYGLNSKWTTIYRELKNASIFLKFLSFLIKKRKKINLPSEYFVVNKISSYLFDFQKINISIIKKEIDQVDAVLFCGIFSNGFLKEILEYSFLSKKSLFFRTTGTITEVPDNLKFFLNKVSTIIVHSSSNASVLKENGIENSTIIDQTTLSAENLINIPIFETNELRYGYIGRFSPEKGIIELLENFGELKKKLIIAGNGPFLNEVKDKCHSNLFYEYIGEIAQNNLISFFTKIDVLIIPSLEESGPLVGIEAMAAGKIILSTKVGAMPERLCETKNQFWFQVEDKKSLEKTVKEIENFPPQELKNIREEVRKKYLNNYSESVISKSYLGLIDNLHKNSYKP